MEATAARHDDPPLSTLRNLGPASSRSLAQVGLLRRSQLAACGSVAAYLQVKAHNPDVTLNLLWALEGALQDCDWRHLPPPLKSRLRAEVEEGSAVPSGT